MFPNVKNNFDKEIHKYVYVIKIQKKKSHGIIALHLYKTL